MNYAKRLSTDTIVFESVHFRNLRLFDVMTAVIAQISSSSFSLLLGIVRGRCPITAVSRNHTTDWYCCRQFAPLSAYIRLAQSFSQIIKLSSVSLELPYLTRTSYCCIQFVSEIRDRQTINTPEDLSSPILLTALFTTRVLK